MIYFEADYWGRPTTIAVGRPLMTCAKSYTAIRSERENDSGGRQSGSHRVLRGPLLRPPTRLVNYMLHDKTSRVLSKA
jgi:hypothetical protein